MPNLLSNLNNITNQYKGSRLMRLLAILFVIFLVLGLSVGYVFNRLLPEKQGPSARSGTQRLNQNSDEVSYEGIVTYIEPFFYPQDEITFTLNDSFGNEVVLLRADDQKLEVSEGHYVTAYGTEEKLSSGDGTYLLVDKVVIKNGAN